MTAPAYKVLADALEDCAARLVDAADELRDLDAEHEPEPDVVDRKRATARERMRRYRARRAADAQLVYPRPRNSDARNPRNSDAPDDQNFEENSAPLRRPNDSEVGRRNDEGGVTRVTSDARNARNSDAASRTAHPSNPWQIPPLDDDEREVGQARIRDLKAQLKELREQ